MLMEEGERLEQDEGDLHPMLIEAQEEAEREEQDLDHIYNGDPGMARVESFNIPVKKNACVGACLSESEGCVEVRVFVP